jgi:cell division protein FtsI (penicillin-binding protein 3)
MHRANSSYGYGMLVTFTQLFKAYSAFNNDGVAVTPRLVNYLRDAKGNQYTLDPKVGDLQPIGKKAANQIHDILLEVVKRGTGVKAQYPGLEIGGKTGTAHIAKHGHYVKEYHSSFYGFVNDKFGNKYTIGVLVIRAKKRYKYFASQSAVPTFKNIVRILVEQGKLTPDPKVITQIQKEDNLYESEHSQETTLREEIKKKLKPKRKKRVKQIKESVAMPQLAPPKYTPPPMPDDVEDLF